MEWNGGEKGSSRLGSTLIGEGRETIKCLISARHESVTLFNIKLALPAWGTMPVRWVKNGEWRMAWERGSERY